MPTTSSTITESNSRSVMSQTESVRSLTLSESRYWPFLSALFSGGMVFLTAATCIFIASRAGRTAFKQEFARNLIRLAQSAAVQVDPEIHQQIRSPSQQESPEFYAIANPLKRMLQSVDGVRFVYTAVMIEDQVYFVVDSAESGDHDGDGRDDQAKVMEIYDEPDQAMVQALVEQIPTSSETPYQDDWGCFISGFAPIFDDDGECQGVVGVDITGDEYNARLASMQHAAIVALVPAALISLAVGFGVGWAERIRSISRSYRRLAEVAMEQRAAELIETNARLAEAQSRAEIANQSKSEFLANMSHEIRTPMTAIIGFAEMIEDGSFDSAADRRREAVSTICENGRHLLSVINDILDLSKIEAGKMTVERIPLNIAEQVERVGESLSGRAGAKGLDLVIEWGSDLPKFVEGDPVRIRQILVNLIGNAIKFTERGSVRVRVQAERKEPSHLSLKFLVQDTGIGMTAEQTEKLFQPFSQADTSCTRKFGGTGLGLSISKRLARLMGGDISVTSTEQVGSEFLLEVICVLPEQADWVSASQLPRLDWNAARFLAMRQTVEKNGADHIANVSNTVTSGIALAQAPVGKSESSIGEKPAALPLSGMHVLLAEDGIDNQRLISIVLRKAGATVSIVDNGALAVDRLMQSSETQAAIDLVLMDMQMPVMDGYEASRVLRAAGNTIPVLALTAHAMNGERDRCLQSGCDDYLTKPIDRPKLVERIAHWVKQRRAAALAQPTR